MSRKLIRRGGRINPLGPHEPTDQLTSLPPAPAPRMFASMRSHFATAFGLAIVAAPVGAQAPAVGTLHGVVREQVGTRSVRSAYVSLVRVESESSRTLNAHPDDL